MTMDNWLEKPHGFLQLNEREILEHAGKISHEPATEHARVEYEKFHHKRLANYESDFDRIVKKLEKGKKGLKGGKNG